MWWMLLWCAAVSKCITVNTASSYFPALITMMSQSGPRLRWHQREKVKVIHRRVEGKKGNRHNCIPLTCILSLSLSSGSHANADTIHLFSFLRLGKRLWFTPFHFHTKYILMLPIFSKHKQISTQTHWSGQDWSCWRTSKVTEKAVQVDAAVVEWKITHISKAVFKSLPSAGNSHFSWRSLNDFIFNDEQASYELQVKTAVKLSTFRCEPQKYNNSHTFLIIKSVSRPFFIVT